MTDFNSPDPLQVLPKENDERKEIVSQLADFPFKDLDEDKDYWGTHTPFFSWLKNYFPEGPVDYDMYKLGKRNGEVGDRQYYGPAFCSPVGNDEWIEGCTTRNTFILCPVSKQECMSDPDMKREIFHLAKVLYGDLDPYYAEKNTENTGDFGSDVDKEWAPIIFKDYKTLGSGDLSDEEKYLENLKKGGNIFILGHGNMGTGIGTHHNKLGATKMVEWLAELGLPKADDIEGKIFITIAACWGGCATYENGIPYGMRLQEKLLDEGYAWITILGANGSWQTRSGASGYTVVVYKDHKTGGDNDYTFYPIHYPHGHSIFEITKGGMPQMYGKRFIANKSTDDDTYNVYKVFQTDEPYATGDNIATSFFKKVGIMDD